MKLIPENIAKWITVVGLILCAYSELEAQPVDATQPHKVKWVGVSGKNDQFYFLVPEGFQIFVDGDYFQKQKDGSRININSRRTLARSINGAVLMLDFYEGDAAELRKALTEQQKGDLIKDEVVNGFRFLSYVQKTAEYVWKTQYYSLKNRLYVLKGVSRAEDNPMVRSFFESVRLETQKQFAAPNPAPGTRADALADIPDIIETPPEKLDDSAAAAVKPDRGAIMLYRPRPRLVRGTGETKLRVLLLSSGKVGKVEVVSSSGREMDEAAIKAAQQIQFLPAEKDGKLVSTYKTMAYSFSTY